MRWHHADDDFRITKHIGEAVCGGDRVGDGGLGEEEIVEVAGVDALADFRLVRPETNLRFTATAQDDCNGRGPCPRSDHSDPAHGPSFLPPKRFSLPASRRPMLSLWRMIISREEATMNTMTAASRVSRLSHHAAMGKTAAPKILPKET